MTTTRAGAAPPPLVVAAALTGIEAAVLTGMAVVELAHFTSSRAALGLTTTMFFLAYAAGLAWCARAVTRGESWARSPIVLTQLIQIGVATSFWGGDTTLLAVGLIVVALVVIAGVLHPASIAHLAEDG
jgi:dolichyl-phosphate-mannose--protein O-mannosyl transferase